ncbi:MAG: DUF1800 domain-containing protein [Phycisphaerales bacterium]
MSQAPVHRAEHGFSRRAMFAGGLAAAAGLMATAGRRSTARAAPPAVSADVDPGALLNRLVSRITFGINEAELTLATTLGFQGYLDYQLAYEAIDDSAVESRISGGATVNGTAVPALGTINRTGQQLYDTAITPNSNTIVTELIEATIVRAVYSQRQLYQRMVEFWTDHFNIDITLDSEIYLKSLDDRLVIRQHAMTSFPQLLNASAHSPAMMYYLNNDLNKYSATNPASINENYAREIIELHTFGANYFYAFPAADQSTAIRAVARCFTGWDWYRGNYAADPSLRATFRYVQGNHDPNAKSCGPVLENITIPARTQANGLQDGMDILSHLGNHPATALYIATKLCRKFLGESCPQSTIDAVRDTYLNPANAQGIGDIKAMLRTILTPANLYESPLRYKRPFHLFVSAMRAVPTFIVTTGSLRTQLAKAGHLPFNWGPPDGYPDTTEYWIGLLLPRWNFGAQVPIASSPTSTGIGGIRMVITDTGGLLATLTTRDTVINRLNQAMFGGEMNAVDKERVRIYMPASGTISNTSKQESTGLAIDSPGFQWY